MAETERTTTETRHCSECGGPSTFRVTKYLNASGDVYNEIADCTNAERH